MSIEYDRVVTSTAWSPGPGCHGGCGVKIYVKGDKVVKVEGDREHPYNHGRGCSRLLAMTQFMYHPERILYPLKRIGPRGDGRFERITWDEAYDIIEEKFNKIKEEYGANSVIFIQGTGRDIGGPMSIVAYNYGSANWSQLGLAGQACYGPRLGAIIWLAMMAWMKKVIKVDKDVPQLQNIDWAQIEAMKPGPMEKREKIVVTVSILLILCWVVPSMISLVDPDNPFYLAMARLADSSFLFLAIVLLAIVKVDGEPLLDLKEGFAKIDWLPVVLLAGIMMVAGAMGEASTGIPAWISAYVVPLVSGMSPYAMVALICVLSVILTNIANNVPVGIIFVSAGVPMCLELGMDPFPLALGVCVAANLAFTIPPAYVPVGIAYADPYCNGKTVFKNGLYMTVVSMIVCAVLVYPLAHVFGG